MTLVQQIEALEAMPLLGSTREEALEAAHRLTQQIDPEQSPELALRVIIVRFLAQPTQANSIAQLATAETWATGEGLKKTATTIQLLWCQAVARVHPDAVRKDVFEQAVVAANQYPELCVEQRLAEAACDVEHTDTHLRAALAAMNEPRFAALKLQAWLDLSSTLDAGADAEGALEALYEALKLCRDFSAHSRQIEVLIRLSSLYMERGLNNKAKAFLEDALSLSKTADDDLNTVVIASILSALYLNLGQADQAAEAADLLLVTGARRGNWFAVVDGHITRSTLLLLEGDLSGAIGRLVRAVTHLRELVPAAAVNLLKGRLAELRSTLGAERFDLYYRDAMTAAQSS